MKRLLFLSLFLLAAVVQALAFDYTDANGVTWTCSAGSDGTATITRATGYGTEVTVPGTVYDGEQAYTTTALGGTFNGATKITKVTLPESVGRIEDKSFYYCRNLVAIEGTENVTYIGLEAFKECSSLTSIDIPQLMTIDNEAFWGCSSLATINAPLVSVIGNYAFAACYALKSVDLPKTTSIGADAFWKCFSLEFVNLPVVTSIGYLAFYENRITEVSLPATLQSLDAGNFGSAVKVVLGSVTPPTLATSSSWGGFSSVATLIVPEASLEAYKSAEGWNEYAGQMLPQSDVMDYDVTTTAQDNASGLSNTIGADNLGKVVSLKVKGTINGYDIMVMRNKMTNLHWLDLSETNIVANDYEYYTGYHTTDNVVGDYSFYELRKLASLKLSNSATAIGCCAVAGCSNLATVFLPKNLLTIGSSAFANDENLASVVIPNGTEDLGGRAFHSCSRLNKVEFPPSLKCIGDNTFEECSSLDSISLPGVEKIGSFAFSKSALKSIKIPSTLKSIGNYAFSCDNLAKVYTYTVEPVNIDQNTFSNYASATLYIPNQSKDNYWYNTQWSQFAKLEPFDEPYKYFYLNKDYTLDDRFKGDPDIDVNPGGGLILPDDKDKDNQEADAIHIKGDGKNWASIIANANLNAKGLYIDITIEKNKWYFFSFPFRVPRANISCGKSARFVFRTYDGGIRAEHGHGGWVEIADTAKYLQPWKGYIFQASVDCTLSIKIEKNDFGLLPKIDAKAELDRHASVNERDAGWNFIGNPFTSYYDIKDMSYDCPITRWNSDTGNYEALRPGDDDYWLHPFEAFFVQKPTDAEVLTFSGDKRLTQTGAEKAAQTTAQAARVQGVFDTSRQIVNLTLSDGRTTDKTRVVFNPAKSQRYEIDCDAAKFETSAAELYTIEAQGGRMAINERPEGSVQVGYQAPTAGEYTIAATRMDKPVLLRDNVLQITFDLTSGDYHFSSEAGRFDNRFMLMVDNTATGIGDIVSTTGVNVKPCDSGLNISNLGGHTLHVYGVNGALYATRSQDGFLSLSKGVYVVEVEGLKAKFMVK